MLGKKLREWLLRQDGKRSPLTAPPLRLPGHWLRGELDAALTDFSLAVVFPLAVGMAWAVWWLVTGLSGSGWPSWQVALAGAVGWLSLLAILWREAWHGRARIRDLRLGMLAEEVVGQKLECCRKSGYEVFHDIPLEGAGGHFNIDHLVVGPGGILVIETKGRSKPKKGEPKVRQENGVLRFADGSYDPNAIPQAEATLRAATALILGWLAKAGTLSGVFGPKPPQRSLPIGAIVVLPGWFTVKEPREWHDIPLANEKTITNFICKSKHTLVGQEVEQIAEAIRAHLQGERSVLLDRWDDEKS